MKKIILAIFGIILGGFALSHNSYAVSDLTYTFDSSYDGAYTVMCYDNEPNYSNCSDYNYLIISYNGTFSSVPPYYETPYLNFNLTGNAGYTPSIYLFPVTETILDLSSFNSNSDTYSININEAFYNTSTFNSGWTITFTFKESIDGSSPAPDCPEPVIPDCDEPFIVRLFEGSFWNIATALIALIVPILALFLVFRLIHGLIYGKGV